MDMRKTACAFTGHRDVPSADSVRVAERLDELVEEMISRRGVTRFLAGGALGFDTEAARAVLRAKASHPEVELVLALPCREQTRGWSEGDKRTYDELLSLADSVVYVSERYFRGCMHKRNRYLIDNASWCIAYKTRDTGGTAYTVQYAERCGVPILLI